MKKGCFCCENFLITDARKRIGKCFLRNVEIIEEFPGCDCFVNRYSVEFEKKEEPKKFEPIKENPVITTVYEVVHKIHEDEENFILETIIPYCEEVSEMKISKSELKDILVRYYRKGKWEFVMDNGNGTSDYQCSNCLSIIRDVENNNRSMFRYCPLCGCKMEGGAK